MKNFHILTFLTLTQNEIGREENVERRQRVLEGLILTLGSLGP